MTEPAYDLVIRGGRVATAGAQFGPNLGPKHRDTATN